MAAKKKNPYRSMGVNENAALRMVKMVQPLCPIPAAGKREEFDKLFPEYLGQVSCQAGRYRRGWEKECEAAGHNPYYYTRRQVVIEPVIGDDGMITGQKQRILETSGPNVNPVALDVGHDSGEAVIKAIARGFKYMTDLGYEEICQFRACESPVKVKTRFGNYCTERHARLIGARVLKKFLVIEGVGEDFDWAREREEQLGSIQLYS